MDRRIAASLVGLMVVGGALIGCASAVTPAGPSHSPAPGSPSPAQTPTPTGLTATSYQVENGTHLIVWFYAGICDKYGVTADESKAGQVGVRVVITQKAPPGTVCPALAKAQSASVDLKQPLGDRKVVDLTSGKTLPVGAAD